MHDTTRGLNFTRSPAKNVDISVSTSWGELAAGKVSESEEEESEAADGDRDGTYAELGRVIRCA